MNSWAYDSKRDRLVFVVAPNSFVADPCCSFVGTIEVWALALSQPYHWEEVPIAGPLPEWRVSGSVTYDDVGDRLLLLGGVYIVVSGNDTVYGDLWQLPLGGVPTWSEVVPAGGTLPGGNSGGAMSINPVANRLTVVCARDTLGTPGERAWTLDLTALDGWVRHDAPIGVPDFDSNAGRVFDRNRQRFLVAGQYSTENSADSVRVWQVDVSQTAPSWQRLEIEGGPPLLRDNCLVAMDEGRDILRLFGGSGYGFDFTHNQWFDLWELSLGGSPGWSRVAGGSRVPFATAYAPAVWDPHRRRAVIAGSGRFGQFSQTLAYDVSGAIPEWSILPENFALTPPGREGSVAIYDPGFDRLILYGGQLSRVELGDLWNLDFGAPPLSAWTRLLPLGETPGLRTKATALYDPVRKRMILFGGYAGQPLNDVWVLNLTESPTWTRLATRGLSPPPRFGHTAVYDSKRDAMIVYGGYSRPAPPTGGLPDVLSDTWVLSFGDHDAWFPLETPGSMAVQRADHAALYDPIRDRMIVLWGRDRAGRRSDSRVLDLAGIAQWREFLPEGSAPEARLGAAVVYDADVDQALVLSGDHSDGFTPDWAILWGTPDAEPPPFGNSGPPLALLGMAPNPTAGAVDVAFEVPGRTIVHIRIYDARGRLVRDLGSRAYEEGRHIAYWDGKSDQGTLPASGVYLARLSLGAREYKGKIVLLR